MFERAVDQIIDKFMFDPVQFYLVTIDSTNYLRYQYFGRYETTKEIPLGSIELSRIKTFMEEVENHNLPTSFDMKSAATTYSFKVKRKAEENKLCMSFVRKFMGFPVSWLAFKGQQKDLLRLANGLSSVA